MKRIRKIWWCSMLFLFAACVTGGNREVLHGSHNNRAERVVRDSIYLRDSVFVAMRADTVFYEKQRTVFRDRLSIDTFIVCDTLFKERVVTVEKVVKQYPSPWFLLSAVVLYVAWRKGVLHRLWSLLKVFIG
ncbi:MAG: hypothetical protein IJY98_08155 [Bacteroidaceae bacterium]|nr:hypothetical protein [Bacteroidales bacterium]MBO5263512.1 hypothetical protein [Bacteroidaceae bacterium]MBQ8257869.1 hypothetical protein [Bacteroidaceae bacterium]